MDLPERPVPKAEPIGALPRGTSNVHRRNIVEGFSNEVKTSVSKTIRWNFIRLAILSKVFQTRSAESSKCVRGCNLGTVERVSNEFQRFAIEFLRLPVDVQRVSIDIHRFPMNVMGLPLGCKGVTVPNDV